MSVGARFAVTVVAVTALLVVAFLTGAWFASRQGRCVSATLRSLVANLKDALAAAGESDKEPGQ